MQTKRAKLIVDILLGVSLLLLMSCQAVGEAGHEWTGIAMTVLMIIHQILNRKWIAALFKGKYTPLRITQTCINAALLICFLLTALCGVNMSVHAVPFLGDFMRASLGRRLHLTLSHWCFVLMGLHLGLHIPAMLKGVKSQTLRRAAFGLSIPAAGAGLWLFLRNSFPDYLFFRVPFAFIDYDKAIPLVLLEALLIAFFWVFIGAQLPKLLNRRADKTGRLIAPAGILSAVLIGMGLIFIFPAGSSGGRNENAAPWDPVSGKEVAEEPAGEMSVPAESPTAPAAEREEFKVTRMDLKDPLHIFSEQPGDFAIYHCVSGEAVIQPGPGADAFSPVDIKAGHTILVPSEVNDFLLLPTREGTVLLEAVTEKRNVPDSYTGSSDQPDAPDPHVRIWN